MGITAKRIRKNTLQQVHVCTYGYSMKGGGTVITCKMIWLIF